MDSKTKKHLLRFPEFTQELEENEIIDFAPLQRGFDLPVSDIVEGEFPVVFSNGILKTHHEYRAKAPGVVTGRSGTIGKVTFVETDYWPHNTAFWVTSFKENDAKYVYYFYSQFNLERFATGSGVPTLNRNDVHSQSVFVPSPFEQRKIAAFLTAVDKKIEQLARKKALLEQYKKGVMQKIFNQEIRFRAVDGTNFPDWEEKMLGEIANLYQPITISQSQFTPNGFSVFGANGLIGKYSKFNHRNRQVTVSCRGENSGQVNLTPEFCWITGNSMVVNIENSGTKILLDFFYYVLSSKSLKYLVTGTGQPQITRNYLVKHVTHIPGEVEQQKIASFLSSIDEKINFADQQVEKLRTYKKGLLQQMFI